MDLHNQEESSRRLTASNSDSIICIEQTNQQHVSVRDTSQCYFHRAIPHRLILTEFTTIDVNRDNYFIITK